jgi:hypothetical protein
MNEEQDKGVYWSIVFAMLVLMLCIAGLFALYNEYCC